MKTNAQSTTTFRTIIRWTAGIATMTILLVAACQLFPLMSSLPAFALTSCLVAFCGLQIALPPIDTDGVVY